MKINEIFYSIQGEGFYTGNAAVFIRFSKCNLKCPFCDTNFEDYSELTEDEVIKQINKYHCRFVVLTGGEPSLQITKSFIDKLHENGWYIAIETNGTKDLSEYNIDWITCSPKSLYTKAKLNLKKANESKVVLDDIINENSIKLACPESQLYYIQPCDVQDERRNKIIQKRCIDFILHNPEWKLSLQTQKIINVK